MVTIESTSARGGRKSLKLLENAGRGRVFEAGKTIVETTEFAAMLVPQGTRGKVIGFNRSHSRGLTSEVLKVKLEGRDNPCNLKFKEVRIVNG